MAAPTPSAAPRCAYAVLLRETRETYLCGSTETLLQGMARIGRKCIPTGCLNGGCGVCKVAIRSGSVSKSAPMSRAHVSEQEEEQGVVLACRVVPASAVEIEVIGKMKKAFARGPWNGIVSRPSEPPSAGMSGDRDYGAISNR
jgi:ferredoxin